MVLLSHTLLRTLYPFKLLETRTVKKIGISHKYRTLFRRVRGCISGRSLPVQTFVEYPQGFQTEPPRIGHHREYPPPGHSRK